MAITFGAGVSFGGGIALGAPSLGAPTVTTATALSTSSALVTFIPPTDLGGLPVNRYTVVSNTGSASTTVLGNTTTAVVTGLSQGQSYSFAVQATNDHGTGPFSSFASTVTMTFTI